MQNVFVSFHSESVIVNVVYAVPGSNTVFNAALL